MRQVPSKWRMILFVPLLENKEIVLVMPASTKRNFVSLWCTLYVDHKLVHLVFTESIQPKDHLESRSPNFHGHSSHQAKTNATNYVPFRTMDCKCMDKRIENAMAEENGSVVP